MEARIPGPDPNPIYSPPSIPARFLKSPQHVPARFLKSRQSLLIRCAESRNSSSGSPQRIPPSITPPEDFEALYRRSSRKRRQLKEEGKPLTAHSIDFKTQFQAGQGNSRLTLVFGRGRKKTEGEGVKLGKEMELRGKNVISQSVRHVALTWLPPAQRLWDLLVQS